MNHQVLYKISLWFLYLFSFFISFSIAGTQISYSLALILFIILVSKRHIIPEFKTSFNLPLLLLFLVGIIATIFSLSPGESFYNLKKFLLVPIIFLIPGLIQTRKELIILLSVFLGTACLVAIFGIGKYIFTSWSKVIATQSTTMTWGAMSVFFVVAWASLFSVLKDIRFRILSLIALLFQIMALGLSYVRGAYLGAFLGVLIISLLKQKKLIIYMLIIFSLLLMFFPDAVLNRIKSIPDLSVPSTQLRLNQWQDSIRIFKDYPILGVGWIDLHDVHISHAPPGADLSDERFHIGHFHNNFVTLLMLFGSIGLFVFLWLFVQILRQQWKNFKITESDSFLHAVTLFAFASTVGFLLNGMFDWTFGDEEVVMILWFSIGLSLTAQKLYSSGELKTEVID